MSAVAPSGLSDTVPAAAVTLTDLASSTVASSAKDKRSALAIAALAALPRCRECNNRAKRECVNIRCRTCCLRQQEPCPIHLKPDKTSAATAEAAVLRGADLSGRAVSGRVESSDAATSTHRITVTIDGRIYSGILFEPNVSITFKPRTRDVHSASSPTVAHTVPASTPAPANDRQTVSTDIVRPHDVAPPITTTTVTTDGERSASPNVTAKRRATYSRTSDYVIEADGRVRPKRAYIRSGEHTNAYRKLVAQGQLPRPERRDRKHRADGKPRKPRSPFIFFQAALNAQLTTTTDPTARANIKQSHRWRDMTETQRQPYIQMWKLDQERWRREIEIYQKQLTTNIQTRITRSMLPENNHHQETNNDDNVNDYYDEADEQVDDDDVNEDDSLSDEENVDNDEDDGNQSIAANKRRRTHVTNVHDENEDDEDNNSNEQQHNQNKDQ